MTAPSGYPDDAVGHGPFYRAALAALQARLQGLSPTEADVVRRQLGCITGDERPEIRNAWRKRLADFLAVPLRETALETPHGR